MENFTIHIFNYGETQINSKDLSVKVNTSLVSGTTETLIDDIWNLRPDQNVTEKVFHVIHIFNYDDIRWLGGDYSFTLKNQTQLTSQIDSLITQLDTLNP
jgi:hypothetical protein